MNLLKLLGMKKDKPKKRAINAAFEYGTHLPVSRALIEVFKPKGVLELGAGKFSTPLFYQKVKKLVTIETDATWIGEVAKIVPPRDGFELIHHSVKLSSKTRARSISQKVKDECVAFYRNAMARHSGLDYLFIDQVSGLRAFTLFSLYRQFEFVVYHDAEDKGYGYEQFADCDNGEYFHFLMSTYIPFSGILIHRKHAAKMAEFKQALERHALAYWTEHFHFELRDLTTGQLRECA